jgi:transposase
VNTLTTDRAVLAASVLMIRALASQMQTTLAAIHGFDAEIAPLCAVNEDFALMQSLPGAGQNYAARLMVALGTDRERWQSADESARLFGAAPMSLP